jgi:hypothetical protein
MVLYGRGFGGDALTGAALGVIAAGTGRFHAESQKAADLWLGLRSACAWGLSLTFAAGANTPGLGIDAALAYNRPPHGRPLTEIVPLPRDPDATWFLHNLLPVPSGVNQTPRYTGKWYRVGGSKSDVRRAAELAQSVMTIDPSSDVIDLGLNQQPSAVQLTLYSHTEGATGATCPPYYEGALFIVQAMSYAPLPRWFDTDAFLYVPGGINEDNGVGAGVELLAEGPGTQSNNRFMGPSQEGYLSSHVGTDSYLRSAVAALPPCRAIRVSSYWLSPTAVSPAAYRHRTYGLTIRLWD